MGTRLCARLVPALVFLLCTVTALPAFAESKLVITTDRPIGVFVDGELLSFEDGTTRVEMTGIEPGRHLVEFRAMFGRLVDSAEFEVPAGDAIVRARWANQTFDVYETLVLEPEPLVDEVILIEEPDSGGLSVEASDSFDVAGGSASVHMDVVVPSESTETTTTTTTMTASAGFPMMGGTSMTTTETTTVHSSSTVGFGGASSEVVVVESSPEVVYVEEVAPIVPATRTVTFRSTDEEWANVYLDGKNVWELRAGEPEKTITVSTGEHTLEIKDFMENETWCRGRLIVDGMTDLIIGIAEDSVVEVYNDSSAFIP